ncbi:MAG: tetratricopeptide repeat protein, partial [Magnetococcales bacterium]|nr:tetratricopeptide repeat protein [Magnetococcales bacterium]
MPDLNEIQALSLTDLIIQAGERMNSGQTDVAIELYRQWLAHNSTQPLAYAVHYNYGILLLNISDLPGAKAAFEESIRLNPDFYPPYINLGNVLERVVSPMEAAACWQRLADRLPSVNAEAIGYKTSALKQIARVLGMAEAETALQHSLEINPHQHEAMEHWINARQLQCKWPVIEPFGSCDKRDLMKGFAPLSLAVYTDDPMLQLANASYFHQSEIGQPQPTFLDHHEPLRATPGARPRIGYLSSDLRIHAIGYLMVELFELHDRQQVEIFVYSIGPQFEDPIRQRIRNAVEHWQDLSTLSDPEAAAQILADRIEILIDVNGYTHSSRTKLLSMRPAPVIVNWLGYPGTMGSPYHQYLIADEFIIPKGHEIFYSEQVVRLPCYQPNDRKRVVAPHYPSRSESGLPEAVMVYGCFNGVKKITSYTWHLWMEILRQVPQSVLWLLFENEVAKGRLLELAALQGVAPERILFAPRLNNAEHMARYALVDLMLDSSPYGAHTTASDALWMGVPVLTYAGLSFASRVCGSLVRAAGLAELVCTTSEAFVARAVELGGNPTLLQSVRQRLRDGRDTCVLFDTPSLVSCLEKLYFSMWNDFQQNRIPRPDLTNLDIYQEIGIELDQGGVWFGTIENLTSAYLEKLLEWDRLTGLIEDKRLWNENIRRHHTQTKQGFSPMNLNLADLIGHADVLTGAGQMDQAIRLYQQWLASNPAHPQAHYIHYNHGVLLLNSNALAEAKQAFSEAIRLQPDFYPPYINLGNVLERLVSTQAAVACWQQLVDRLSAVVGETIGLKISALQQIARVSDPVAAEEALRQSLEITPHQPESLLHWIVNRQGLCKWPVIEPFAQCDRRRIMKGFAPLSLAIHTDDPMLQLANAHRYHQAEIGQPQPTFHATHHALRVTPSLRPRIG